MYMCISWTYLYIGERHVETWETNILNITHDVAHCIGRVYGCCHDDVVNELYTYCIMTTNVACHSYVSIYSAERQSDHINGLRVLCIIHRNACAYIEKYKGGNNNAIMKWKYIYITIFLYDIINELALIIFYFTTRFIENLYDRPYVNWQVIAYI